MGQIWASAAFRLALSYGVLAVGSSSVVSAVFYLATVGVVAHSADAKLAPLSDRLAAHYAARGRESVRQEIDQLLDDGVDQDTEVYQLVGPDGRKIAGNLAGWTPSPGEAGRVEDRGVIRNGQPSVSRLLPRLLPDGAILVVGHDLRDQLRIEQIVWRAVLLGAICATTLAAIGALLFRRQLERRIAAIHRTAHEIEAGDLSRRIPVAGDDEFARLGRDINRMLDEIERLMSGVRHVSNAIAHDLRTPLGRIRSQLDEALRFAASPARLDDTARSAITQIDELIQVFDRLLQIAEAEAGTRRQSFTPVLLQPVIADVVELYDASAEGAEITQVTQVDHRAATLGDRNLLAVAVANLLDNALKYAGRGATVRVRAEVRPDTVAIIVEDDGPGIPDAERARVVERFYRLDSSRSLPGNGLGLSIVDSIATLHWGSLRLENASPGLRAVITLPMIEPDAVPHLRASAQLCTPESAA
ncbi:MAG: HAMP domain-containing histidine kinase [Alphaproteobacteria bacterium]|nr:HAMP domain-containing histidine kinase [Alphaproteobacteria bacterium]